MPHISNGPPARVLVVEDEPVSAALARRYLEGTGFEVDLATDGEAALAKHAERPYRIVVSDWMMPSMDGVTLCRRFRNQPGPYVYFVLCTARTERSDRAEAFAAGVDDFLTKPVDSQELSARMQVARRILATQDDLRLLSQKYEELFSGLPVACFAFDSDGILHEWNREAEASFGIRADAVRERAIWDALPLGEGGAWSEAHARALLAGAAPATFDWTLRVGGSSRSFLANAMILRSEDQQAVGVLCTCLDITARKQAEAQIAEYARQVSAQAATLETMNEQLRMLAITDELTGLANRRQFGQLLDAALSQARTSRRPVSLLMLDLDHFKQVNDRFGHPTGDGVLRSFANVLVEVAMPGELLARYGGEEFAVLMPGADAGQAKRAGERFRYAIERYPFRPCMLTASVGVATAVHGASTSQELVELADAALYRAKQAGRNQVFASDPPAVEPLWA